MDERMQIVIIGLVFLIIGYLALFVLKSAIDILNKGYLLCGISVVGFIIGIIMKKFVNSETSEVKG